MYYKYAADEKSKKIVMNNIEKSENELLDKYSIDKLFENRRKEPIDKVTLNNENKPQPLLVKKETIFSRIWNRILIFLGRN